MNEITNNQATGTVANTVPADTTNNAVAAQPAAQTAPAAPDTFQKSADAATNPIQNAAPADEAETPKKTSFGSFVKHFFAGKKAAKAGPDNNVVSNKDGDTFQKTTAQAPAEAAPEAPAAENAAPAAAQAPQQTDKSKEAEKKIASIKVPDPNTVTADTHL